MDHDLLIRVFQFHYYRDMMNAATHMAVPRFSPITQALCIELESTMEDWREGEHIDGFLKVRSTL